MRDFLATRTTSERLFLLLGILALVIQCRALFGPPGPQVPSELHLDKLVHFFLFLVPTALFRAAGIGCRTLACGFGSFALASELIQAFFLHNRSGDVFDLLANTLGIICGLWVMEPVGRQAQERTKKRSLP